MFERTLIGWGYFVTSIHQFSLPAKNFKKYGKVINLINHNVKKVCTADKMRNCWNENLYLEKLISGRGLLSLAHFHWALAHFPSRTRIYFAENFFKKIHLTLYTRSELLLLYGVSWLCTFSQVAEPLTQNAASSWTWPFHNLSRNSRWWSLCMPYAKLKPRYGNYHILPEMGLHLYASYPLAFWPTNSIDSIALLRLSHQSDLVRGDLR